MDLSAHIRRLKLNRLPQTTVFFTGAFALLIVVVLASITLLEQNQTQRDQIVRAHDAQAKLDRLLVFIRRMESGQRGFLITGNTEFLDIYNETLPLVPEMLLEVRRSLWETERQRALWSEVLPLVDGKLAEMAETIRLYRAGQREEAYNLIRSEAGLRYMDRLRALVQRMKDNEAERLEAQYAQSRTQERWLLGVNVVAVLLILALAFASMVIIRRANDAMAKAQAVLKDANTELEAAVAARTAELRQANEEIQKFAYIVSHDLRSPLVNIMGFTSELEMLKQTLMERLAALQGQHKNGGAASMSGALSAEDQTLADDFEEALAFIKASITRMDRLINAVLTISREGNRTLRPEEIDLGSLVASLSQAVAHQAQAAGAQVDIRPLPVIVSDRLALEQVFANLLDNALKYLRPDAAGRVSVSGSAEGNRVVIAVEDNGRGIEAKDLDRIFELFRRAGPQDKPGEGMGLAHVRALVRRLGGVINVKSTPGEGTTFTITLPRMLSQAQGQKRTAA